MLEQVVNVDLPEKQLKKNVNNILSTQLYKLVFDYLSLSSFQRVNQHIIHQLYLNCTFKYFNL